MLSKRTRLFSSCTHLFSEKPYATNRPTDRIIQTMSVGQQYKDLTEDCCNVDNQRLSLWTLASTGTLASSSCVSSSCNICKALDIECDWEISSC